MKAEKIKPVPKYIIERIRRYDSENLTCAPGHTRFYSYLTKNDGELVKVTVAVRNHYKQWLYKQVAVHGLNSKQERKALYDKFAAVASKYLGLEYDKKSVYIAIIAQKPSDLIHEGELLHHCVGCMGYDQKFAREESLIFFIRTKDQPDVPFVTIEYSPAQKRILQCYGDHDSKPTEEVINFVHKKWLPYANRKLKQLAA